MKMQNEPDLLLEKELLMERVWGKYGYNGINDMIIYVKNKHNELLINHEIINKIEKNEYLNLPELDEIRKNISKVISFNEIKGIIDNVPPYNKKDGYDMYLPFMGYYITIDKKWNITLDNKWDELYRELNRCLNKKKPNFAGIKTYALLKTFMINYENSGDYEVSTIKLVSEADSELNQNPEVRVWYNNFNDLIGAGIVYNTRSHKHGEMTILPETMPLIKLILNEYENNNLREVEDVKNGKLPY